MATFASEEPTSRRGVPSVASQLNCRRSNVAIPEIADYEVRRELLRIGSQNALINLDQLANQLSYLPLTTAAMRAAADLWARARTKGVKTAPDHALDGDVILAAQAISLNTQVVVATSNPSHLSRFVEAEFWSNIKP